MNRHGSLFERLAHDPQTVGISDPGQALMHSVTAHLSRMLSTRAGSVQTLPDYGLPDLNDMHLSLDEALSRAQIAIGRFIQRHEPRLTEVVVTSVKGHEDPLRRTFVIRALLAVGGTGRAVKLTATLSATGEVKVTDA